VPDCTLKEINRDMLDELDIYDKETLKNWYDFFKNPWLED
jgi:hypothetical protein